MGAPEWAQGELDPIIQASLVATKHDPLLEDYIPDDFKDLSHEVQKPQDSRSREQ